MAWSYAARRENRDCPHLLAGRRTGGQNRLCTALDWFEERIEPILRAGFCEETGFSRHMLVRQSKQSAAHKARRYMQELAETDFKVRPFPTERALVA
jgi:hypothetical protein